MLIFNVGIFGSKLNVIGLPVKKMPLLCSVFSHRPENYLIDL